MDTLQLTDYADRYLVDRLSSHRRRRAGPRSAVSSATPCASGWTARAGRARAHGRRRARRRCGARTWNSRPAASNRTDRDFTAARGARLPAAEGFRAAAAGQGRRRLRRAPGRRGAVELGVGGAARLFPQQRRAQCGPRASSRPRPPTACDVARAVRAIAERDPADAARGHADLRRLRLAPSSSRPRSSGST